GHSEKPHDANAYGEKMCLDVIRLMDHVGVQRAHMVGYSQGARVVGYLLTVHPDRFITATLGGRHRALAGPPTRPSVPNRTHKTWNNACGQASPTVRTMLPWR